jgi:hypothetical protein
MNQATSKVSIKDLLDLRELLDTYIGASAQA